MTTSNGNELAHKLKSALLKRLREEAKKNGTGSESTVRLYGALREVEQLTQDQRNLDQADLLGLLAIVSSKVSKPRKRAGPTGPPQLVQSADGPAKALAEASHQSRPNVTPNHGAVPVATATPDRRLVKSEGIQRGLDSRSGTGQGPLGRAHSQSGLGSGRQPQMQEAAVASDSAFSKPNARTRMPPEHEWVLLNQAQQQRMLERERSQKEKEQKTRELLKLTYEQQIKEKERQKVAEREQTMRFAHSVERDTDEWRLEMRRKQAEMEEKSRVDKQVRVRQIEIKQQLEERKVAEERRIEQGLLDALKTAKQEAEARELEKSRKAKEEALLLIQANEEQRKQKKLNRIKEKEMDRKFLEMEEQRLQKLDQDRLQFLQGTYSRQSILYELGSSTQQELAEKQRQDDLKAQKWQEDLDAKMAAEEKKRTERQRKERQSIREALDQQLDDQQRRRLEELKERQEQVRKWERDALNAKRMERLREQQRKQKDAENKAALDMQCREKELITSKRHAMSEAERRLNAPLLKAVQPVL